MSNEQFLYGRPQFPAQLNLAHPLARGLVGCWMLNEEGGLRAWDSSPYGLHGTVVGGAKGNYQGRTFDGVDDFITIPASTALNTNSFTIFFWVKPTQLRIQGFAQKGGAPYWRVFMRAVDGTVEFDATGEVANASIPPISTGVFSAIAASYDSVTQLVRLYRNGESGSPVGSIADMNNSQNSVVNIAPSITNRFDGTIGGVWFYSRALSAGDVAWVYREPYAMFLR